MADGVAYPTEDHITETNDTADAEAQADLEAQLDEAEANDESTIPGA